MCILYIVLAVTGLVCILVGTHRETARVWPSHCVLDESVASKAKSAVVNPLLELVPIGDTAANLKWLIRVLYGGVAKIDVALQDGIRGNVRPISVPSFSVSRLAVAFSRPLISWNEKSIESTVQVDVERRRTAEILNGQKKCKFRSIASYADWFKNLRIAFNSQPKPIAAHESFVSKPISANHSSPHAEAYDGIGDASEDSDSFENPQKLPPWDGSLSVLLGSVGVVWGWVSIRGNQGTRLIVALFFLSIIMFAYGDMRLMLWTSKC